MKSVLQTTTTSSQAPCDYSADRDEPPLQPASSQFDLTIETVASIQHPINLAWLHERLSAAIPLVTQKGEGRPIRRVSLVIADDARMIELHRRHLGQDCTTDVLTFVENDEGPLQADIAICADVAARQGIERGHSIERELLLYAIHGLLHCIGFDDLDESGFAAMHAEEDRILKLMGIGATFAARVNREPRP